MDSQDSEGRGDLEVCFADPGLVSGLMDRCDRALALAQAQTGCSMSPSPAFVHEIYRGQSRTLNLTSHSQYRGSWFHDLEVLCGIFCPACRDSIILTRSQQGLDGKWNGVAIADRQRVSRRRRDHEMPLIGQWKVGCPFVKVIWTYQPPDQRRSGLGTSSGTRAWEIRAKYIRQLSRGLMQMGGGEEPTKAESHALTKTPERNCCFISSSLEEMVSVRFDRPGRLRISDAVAPWLDYCVETRAISMAQWQGTAKTGWQTGRLAGWLRRRLASRQTLTRVLLRWIRLSAMVSKSAQHVPSPR